MPPISVLLKPASGLCNLNCTYCFYHDEMQNRDQASFGLMSEETLKNVIRKTILRADCAISFAWQGGEPTLRGLDFFRRAVALQKQYNQKHLRVSNAFQTNGYLLDEDWCRFFAENRFLVGVSVDGTALLHDRYRRLPGGEPTYARVTENIRLLDQYHVDYNILTVVTRDVAENIEEIYAHYKAQGWMYQQYIQCLDPIGCSPGRQPWSLTPELYGDFLIRLFRLWYADLKKGQQPFIRQFENYIGILIGFQPEACDQRGICSIQNVVEADGSVYPCDFYMLDAHRLGNFNENRLDEIDEKRRQIGFLERSVQAQQSCQGCAYFALCRGGCQRHRSYETPGAQARNYFCESYKTFFAVCEEDLRTIADDIRKQRTKRSGSLWYTELS